MTNLPTTLTEESNGEHITVRDFIRSYLIGEIGEIKEKHPYFAMILISVGIEFLGRCLSGYNWDSTANAKFFKEGLTFDSLKRYDDDNNSLYHSLRCGLVHTFLTDDRYSLSKNTTDGNIISCSQIYDDFVKACNDLLNKNDDRLSETFITTKITDNDSVSGSTRTICNK